MKMVIINGTLLHNGQELQGHSLVLEDGKIAAIVEGEPMGERVLDAQGGYISAGWIELHTHGIAGDDFMDADPAGVTRALHAYAAHGVTGVYPTTLSAPFAEIRRALDAMAKADRSGGAAFLGAHLEGPYFAPSQRGAQPLEALCTPADEEYKKLLEEYPFIARMDVAPELEGSEEMAAYLKERGVLCGIAHTDANADVIEAGSYPIATHLYSGMSGVHREQGYRIAGAVEACLLRDDIYCEAICDGIHLPATLLKLIYKVKGVKRMIPVTDSIRGAGLEGATAFTMGSKENGYEAIIKDGVAWIPDFTAFAGSIATYDRLIRTLVGVGIPLADAVRMASETPAKAMGLKKKGRLAPGYDADITVFDENIEILFTVVNGEVVYKRE